MPPSGATRGEHIGAGCTTALAWFTRIPLPVRAARDRLDLALGWLPLVGILVGGAGAATRAATAPLVGALPSAVLAVAVMVIVTGAYHEDGLADAADGLWGGWSPPQRLEIMRDSRLGTYGTIAIAIDLLLRVSLLVPLGNNQALRALVAAHTLGRATVLPLRAWLPDVRPEGAGAALPRPRRRAWVLAGVVTASVVVAALGVWAVAAVAAAGITAWSVGLLARSKLGGVTGDVLGAANELAHLAVLLTVVTLWQPASGGTAWR